MRGEFSAESGATRNHFHDLYVGWEVGRTRALFEHSQIGGSHAFHKMPWLRYRPDLHAEFKQMIWRWRRSMIGDKPNSVLSGTVEKIISPAAQDEPEMVQIQIAGSGEPTLLRIENKVEDDLGNEMKLREGAKVSLKIEAEREDTIPPPTT